MIREAYYKNSKGAILNFLADPYYTAEADWYDSEWDETASGYQKMYCTSCTSWESPA